MTVIGTSLHLAKGKLELRNKVIYTNMSYPRSQKSCDSSKSTRNKRRSPSRSCLRSSSCGELSFCRRRARQNQMQVPGAAVQQAASKARLVTATATCLIKNSSRDLLGIPHITCLQDGGSSSVLSAIAGMIAQRWDSVPQPSAPRRNHAQYVCRGVLD